MRRRMLREDEKELWARCVRDVTPLSRLPATTGDKSVAGATQPAGGPAAVPARRETTSHASTPAVSASAVPKRETLPSPETAYQKADSSSLSYLSSAEAAIAAHLRARATRHGGASGQAAKDLIGARQPGLDTRSWKRLATGQMAIERRLDLHGMTAQAAFMRLHAFLLDAYRGHLRCVEIVTGLGSGPEGGILRRELPFWLGRPDLKHLVLAATHSHHANQGAVRVLLRRHGPPPGKNTGLINTGAKGAGTTDDDSDAMRTTPHATRRKAGKRAKAAIRGRQSHGA